MQVKLLSHMGDDLMVVNAARVSFAKQKSIFGEDDAKLLRYLAKHGHWTPFSHPQMQFYVKVPIFVARQLFKHKVGLTENEVSRRYVDSEPEFYWPDEWRERAQNKKQGSGQNTVKLLIEDEAQVRLAAHLALSVYKKLLENGVCPEQARMVLPQNMYTEFYWTGSLAAFMRVVHLRNAEDAQEETRGVARAIETYVEDIFPMSHKALRGD